MLALDSLTLEIGSGTPGLVGPTAPASRRCSSPARPHPATGGRAGVLGHDVATEGEPSGAVGYLPEHDCLPPDVSASDFVVHLAMMSGLPAVAARERAAEVLRHVGLAEERYRPMGGYSTGMKQKAKLAQALAHDPRLVLLDEPTNGLDPAAREEMLGLVQRIGHDSASPSSSPPTCSASSSGSATTSSCSTAAGCSAPRAPTSSSTPPDALLVEVLGDDAPRADGGRPDRSRLAAVHAAASSPSTPPAGRLRRARPHPRHRQRPRGGAGAPPGRPPPHRGRLRRRRRPPDGDR